MIVKFIKNSAGIFLVIALLAIAACGGDDDPVVSVPCPTTGKVYVANKSSSSVSVIGLDTNKVCKTIAVGSDPAIWEFDRINNRIYVNNYGGSTVSVIDTTSDMVVATLNTGQAPSATELDTTLNLLYVVNETDESLSIFSTTDFTTYTEHANSPIVLPSGSLPHKLRANSTTGIIYVLAARNDVFEIDGNNLAMGIQSTIDLSPSNPTGTPSLRRIRIDEISNTVYVTRAHSDTAADRLSIIDAGNNSVTNIIVNEGAGRLVLDAAKDVYIAATFSSLISTTTVTHVDVSAGYNTQLFTSGERPDGIRVTSNGATVYTANRGENNTGNTVSVISTEFNTKTDITVGGQPRNLSLSETLNRLVVSNRGATNTGNTVSIIDTSNNTVVATVTVGTKPGSIRILE